MSENVNNKKDQNESKYLDYYCNEDKLAKIIDEQNIMFNCIAYKKIIKYEKCVCKIHIKEKAYATGFFAYIPSKEIRVLITNNHVIDKKFLEKERELKIYIVDDLDEIEKIINLKSERFKFTDAQIDTTIIEILDEDLIEDFFEVDEEYLKGNEFLNEKIFNFQFPKGGQLNTSSGKIISLRNNNIQFIHDAGTLAGSSGSPIILTNGYKIIGLHKGAFKENYNNLDKKKNVGVYLSKIIEYINPTFSPKRMNVIKCIYNINQENVNKDVKIYDNRNNIERYIDCISIYREDEEKKLIHNGICKFKKQGKYFISYTFNDSVKELNEMFYNCVTLKKVFISRLSNSKIETMENMFNGCINLKDIYFSKNFNTENVINMSKMFANCSSLEHLNISYFNTSNVEDMSYMFNRCLSLSNINLSSFKTNKVKFMNNMFMECEKLKKINLSSIITKSVEDMSKMFEQCISLEKLDLSSFITIKVLNMKEMFKNCHSLKEIYLPLFKKNKETKIDYMFLKCSSLKEIHCKDQYIRKEFMLQNEKFK